jgi:hypothetical protein
MGSGVATTGGAVSIAATVGAGSSSRTGATTGATAGATVGVGGAINVMTGGFRNSVALQPISVEGSTGLYLGAGIAAMRLEPAVYSFAGTMIGRNLLGVVLRPQSLIVPDNRLHGEQINHALELVFGTGFLVPVWVVFQGKFSVFILDFVFTCAPRHTEYVVVVTFRGQCWSAAMS